MHRDIFAKTCTQIFIRLHLFLSWSFLEVTTSSQYNDSIQAYAAGAVEAALTSQVCFILHSLFNVTSLFSEFNLKTYMYVHVCLF